MSSSGVNHSSHYTLKSILVWIINYMTLLSPPHQDPKSNSLNFPVLGWVLKHHLGQYPIILSGRTKCSREGQMNKVDRAIRSHIPRVQ